MTKQIEPKTVPYSETLFQAVMKHQLDYLQTGETVCGAEDPAVITLGDSFGTEYPEYTGLTVCRVTERYVSAWKSDTFLEFSTEEATGTEYSASYALMGDDDDDENNPPTDPEKEAFFSAAFDLKPGRDY